MKNLGKAAFTVVALAAVAAGCFSDPTSDLRNGPDRLTLSNRVVVQRVGEIDQIDIQVRDEQGNSLPFGAPTFTSLDPTIATMAPLPDPTLVTVPGNTLYKSEVTAISSGTTQIVVTAGGVSDTVTVYVLPVATGAAAVGNSVFGAGTELTIAAPPNTTFNTTGTVTTVSLGLTAGTVTSRTATSMTVISPVAYTGPFVVRNLTTSGTQAVDTIIGPSITIAPAAFTGTLTVGNGAFGTGAHLTIGAPAGTEFDAAPSATVGATATTRLTATTTSMVVIAGAAATGTVTVSGLTMNGLPLHPLPSTVPATVARATFTGTATIGASALGANTLLSLVPPAGQTFSIVAPLAGVSFGATAGIVLTRTANLIEVISPTAFTGSPTVSGVISGGVTAPALPTTNAVTISAANFPGTVTTGGNLLNVITVTATGGATLAATAQVVTGGQTAYVLSRTGTVITAIARVPGAISVTNVVVGGVTISSLTPAGGVTVTATTGETGEPGNSTMLSTVTLTTTTGQDTLFGALTPGTDANDFYRVILAAPGVIEAFLDFQGTGTGTAPNPDIDVYVTRDVNGNGAIGGPDICDEFGGSFAEADCTGATAGQPEHEITQTLPAGTYYINVELFLAGGVTTPMTYRLRYILP